MRPRKVVMLECPDSATRSVFSMVLNTRGYRVVSNPCDLALVSAVLFVRPVADEATLALAGQVRQANRPLILAGQKDFSDLNAFATNLVCPYPNRPASKKANLLPDMVEIIEALRVAVARKRGPKKGFREVKAVAA